MSANSLFDYSGKTVVVGLTGRISSAVTALLLKKQGMNVIGLTIVKNSQDLVENEVDLPKCHIKDLDKIKVFCESMKIPFYATDAKDYYEDAVLDPLLASRLTGKANNSCFNCTTMRIKILSQKMKQLKADFFATGHYAKVQKNEKRNEFFILSNSDPHSDQSFLLSSIDKNDLKHLLLPLGELKHEEVVKIGQKFNLPVDFKETQKEFCFKGKNSFVKFAKSKVPKNMSPEGQVQNIDTDVLYGEHEGIINHYITERDLPFRGLGQNEKDIEIVGYNYQTDMILIGSKSNLTYKSFQLTKLKLSDALDRSRPLLCFVKTKNISKALKCKMFFKTNRTGVLFLDEEIYPLLSGDMLTIFDKDGRNAKVIGNGIIGETKEFHLIDRASEFRKNDEIVDEDEDKVEAVQLFKF